MNEKIICEERTDEGIRLFKDGCCGTIRTIGAGGDKRVIEVKQIGNVMPGTNRENPNQGRVYDKEGLAPTISCMGGGNLQPMIVASRGRNKENPSDRTPGTEVEQRLEPNSEGICNTLTSVQKDNLVLEPAILTPKRTEYGKAIRKAYESGEVQESRHNMTELQPRDDGICNTLTTVQKDNLVLEPKVKCLNYNSPQSQRVYETDGVMTTIDVGTYGRFNILEPQYRIRKLTPLECWRLMGFSDEDFYKAKFIFENEQTLEELTRDKFYRILYSNLSESKKLYHIKNLEIKTRERMSNTQLYKQAGNSIVVNVLEAIFKQML